MQYKKPTVIDPPAHLEAPTLTACRESNVAAIRSAETAPGIMLPSGKIMLGVPCICMDWPSAKLRSIGVEQEEEDAIGKAVDKAVDKTEDEADLGMTPLLT